MRWIKLVFILMIFPALLLAQGKQTGKITGVIRSADNKPAENINVVLKPIGKGTITNINGAYEFNNIAAGNYTIEAGYVGLHTKSIYITVEKGQLVAVPDIVLAENIKRLEEVVVVSVAHKFAKKESEYVARMPITNLENPQVYSVIPKELFTEQVATDYRIALMNAPGINNVTQSLGSGGVGLSVRMRGFAGNAGTIRNGMNTNWVTMSDPVNLESIEVIKGPSATIFGSTLVSYGGLINRVTKKPFNYFKGEISYTTGNWSLGRTTIDINTPLSDDKKLLFRFNGALDNQKTWQDYGRNNSLVLAPTFSYQVSPKLKIDFEVEHFNYKVNSTYVRLTQGFNDSKWDFKKSYTTNDFRSQQKSTNVFVKATYNMSNAWQSETYVSTSHTDNNANYLFLNINAVGDSLTRQVMKVNSIFNTSQIQQNFIGNFSWGKIKNKVLAGAEYTHLGTNDTRWRYNYDKVRVNGDAVTGEVAVINTSTYEQTIGGIPPFLAASRSYTTFAAYVSDVVSFSDKFFVMLSMRYSHYNDGVNKYKQSSISPKLGLVYQLLPKKLSFFANYTNGYLNISPRVTRASAPNLAELKPEYANQWEGGAKFELLNGKLNGTLSYYNIIVKNSVRPDPIDPNYSIQDGTRVSKGFEFDLIANPVNGLNLIVGYAYNDSRYIKAAANVEGKRPYSTPLHVGNFWVSYRIMKGGLKGLGLGVGGNSQDKSFYNDLNTVALTGFTNFDGSVFYELSKLRLAVKLNNISNEKYWTSDYWATPMPTRQLVANITFRF